MTENSNPDADGINNDDYVNSSELTKGQNEQLRRGKLPREVTLEVIQTIVSIFALILALVAIVLSFRAMSMANDVAESDTKSLAPISESVDIGAPVLDLATT